MSEQKTVFSKLFKKEELASQKIELGVAEDLQNLAAEGASILDVLKMDNSDLRLADKAISDVKAAGAKKLALALKNISSAEGVMKRIAVTLQKAESAAKDLGLDVKSIPGFTPLNKLYSSLEIYTEDKEFSEYKEL